MLRPSNSATSLGSMDSKGDASTGSEGLYDWTAPRFGGLSVASEPKPELTLADGARFPEFRPDDGSLFAAASPDATDEGGISETEIDDMQLMFKLRKELGEDDFRRIFGGPKINGPSM